MEAIGFLSSLLTLISASIDLAKLAKSLYKAPEELVSILFELEHFDALIKETQAIHQTSLLTTGVVAITLRRAETTISELQRLISSKLLDKEVKGSRKVRKLAWMRNKSRINQLREALKECRNGLTMALSAVSSAFTFHADSRLNSIAGSTAENGAMIASLHGSMDLHMLATQRAVEEHNLMTLRILEELGSGRANQNQIQTLSSQFKESLQCVSSEYKEATKVVESDSDSDEDIFYDFPSISNALLEINGSISQAPATPFERSPGFFPERYIQKPPKGLDYKLSVLSMSEYSISSSERVDLYDLKFAISPRKWQTITVFVSTSIKSRYYDVTKLSKSSRTGQILRLPASFEDQIENLLEATSLAGGCSTLSLRATENDTLDLIIDEQTISKYPEDPVLRNAESDLANFIQDLGCPQFFENEVVQLRQYSAHLMVCCLPNGTLCGEVGVDLKSSNSSPAILKDELISRIKTMNAVRGIPGVKQLLGAVVNDRKTRVRGFLYNISNSSVFTQFEEAQERGTRTSWTKCEKWARQIITAVSKIHSTGNVVGTLGLFVHVRLVLDFEDNVMLFGSSWQDFSSGNERGLLPPEERCSGVANSKKEVTTRTDLFQLGLCLWYLAEQEHATVFGNSFCHKAKCPRVAEKCDDPHSNPVALPPLDPSIPKYYQELIDICRAENPSDRWPASKLLTKFPPSNDYESQPPASNKPPIDIWALETGFAVGCDRCANISSANLISYFHCTICLDGNFDMCRSCVEKGLHCLEDEHFLEEWVLEDGSEKRTKRYHSRKTVSGESKETVFQF